MMIGKNNKWSFYRFLIVGWVQFIEQFIWNCRLQTAGNVIGATKSETDKKNTTVSEQRTVHCSSNKMSIKTENHRNCCQKCLFLFILKLVVTTTVIWIGMEQRVENICKSNVWMYWRTCSSLLTSIRAWNNSHSFFFSHQSEHLYCVWLASDFVICVDKVLTSSNHWKRHPDLMSKESKSVSMLFEIRKLNLFFSLLSSLQRESFHNEMNCLHLRFIHRVFV